MIRNLDFPLNEFRLPLDIETTVEDIWTRLGSWRAFVVCVDGRMATGKSVISRYLAYRLNMPAIQSDDYLLGNGRVEYHECLETTVLNRLRQNKPLIFDGVFAAHTVSQMTSHPHCILRIFCGEDETRRWRKEFEEYERDFAADFELRNRF